MAIRGRLWVTLWLVFVLAVLAWVVARQTAAHVRAVRLNEVRTERSLAEAERAERHRRLDKLIPLARRIEARLEAPETQANL